MKTIGIKNVNRNPARNWQINPTRNWQINPARNWQIDPARNWQIDPARNWQINPTRNWQINPTRNWQINPTRNWQINPTRNWQINPERNILLDPIVSSDIPGHYVCSVKDNKCLYFTVKVPTQDVLLFFDADKIFCYFAVKAIDCYSVFSANDLSFNGFLCSNGAGRFNWFTINGIWLCFFT